MRLPPLRPRQDGDKSQPTNNTWVIVIVTVIAVSVVAGAYYFYNWHLKRVRYRRANGRSSTEAKKKTSWLPWNRASRNTEYAPQSQADNELFDSTNNSDARDNSRSSQGPGTSSSTQDREMATATATSPQAATPAGTGVDRNTSIRSIMTLPAYSPSARENERILGREGERAGIDVVLEYPESAGEEEARREGEMESLYQIRAARREENSARVDRRRERREAQSRGDTAALNDISRRARAAASETLSSTLIAAHQQAQQNKDRRVSSVQYADLGVARHDGSRLRANSSESDRRPLLDSAASIASLDRAHMRNPSVSSILSVSSAGMTDDFGSIGQAGRNRSNSAATANTANFEFISLDATSPGTTTTRSRASSFSHLAGSGEASSETTFPQEEPPNYDQYRLSWGAAPPYESPVRTRAPQLPAVPRLPSIQVTESLTPTEPRSPLDTFGGGGSGSRHPLANSTPSRS